MKIALINDTHAGARGENPHVDAHFFRFWNNIFFPYLIQHNISTVVHLGDVVDRRKFVNYKIWNNWRVNFFEKLLLLNCQVHILLGNHDIFHKNTSDINAMEELLYGFHNITIHKTPKEVVFDGLPIALVPWINDAHYTDAMDFLKTTSAPIIFGHLQITGFEMDRGNVCQDGFDRSIFEKFQAVYSGHFHHRSNNGHIYYLGNQYEITWADYDDPRGFHVFDTDTRDLTFIENPHRLFHKIVYNDETMNFEYWKAFDYTPYRNAFVKVVVLKKQNPYLFDTMMNELYKIEPIDIAVVEDFSDTDPLVPDHELVDQAEDTMVLLSKYIDGQHLDVQPDKLKSLMTELYVEALNTEHTA